MILKFILLIIFFSINHNIARNFNSLTDQNTLSSSVVSLIIKGDPVTSHVPYYARVRLDNIQGKFCGGVVVHQKWVITIAKCVNQVHQDVAALQNIIVEVGHFENSVDIPPGMGRFRVLDIVTPSSPDVRSNVDTIALVRLARKMPVFRVAQLCMAPVLEGSPLKSFGLGSTSPFSVSPSSKLMEIQFTEIKYSFSTATFPHVFACPPSQICALTVTEGSSICFMDEGTPLMSIFGNGMSNCNREVRRNPMCVLGIASHSQPTRIYPNVPCGTSYFTSVYFYSNWIQTVISHDNYPNP
ncbi:myeloblastin-like [Convolutriloba macropyga]|uniref:myeloblastin-like n=1 Tax=Convolutriloba macropyga TaxID=536237 RepID=UPI003F51C4C9